LFFKLNKRQVQTIFKYSLKNETSMKKLRMLLTLLLVSVCSWQSAWADVEVSVTLSETNSLNNELTAQSVTDVKTITKLTVKTNDGVKLGDEDWSAMQSMSGLVELDLSQASADAVPNSQFSSYSDSGSTYCPNLVTVKLPNGLQTIGSSAFYQKSALVTVEVPSTVTTIGASAFSGCSLLEDCDLSGCQITSIPSNCFACCSKLNSFTIPSTVTTIGSFAFQYCETFTSALPANIENIGSGAFQYAAMTDVEVVIPENMEVNYSMFDNSGIKSIEFPTTYYQYVGCFDYCNNLTTVTLKSPTVVDYNSAISNAGNVTLVVPSHLVSSYMSHTQWSKYKEVNAISPDVTNYTVSADLKLSNSQMRMAGNPSVFFNEGASFIIAGSAAQSFTDFTTSANMYDYDDYRHKYSMILNESAAVSVSGDYKQRIKVYGYRWYFLCLPFDFTVSDVSVESGSFVIRTYDGAKRNTNNSASENWSDNLTGATEIKAGTGFILQTSVETWVTFKAKSGGTNLAFSKESDGLNIALAANNSNASASTANTGWNMVGNPWQTYYNIHEMNYTAPFAVWSGYSYSTYSPADDDYALRPFHAIFVQCPSGVSEIGFPSAGRQLTSEITGQSGARAVSASPRKLFDIQIVSGELNDKTRLVVNPEATMEYEIGRDASKFFADGTATPQIYSLDADGTQYAINERPADSGTLRLGIIFAADGEYTLKAIRNQIGEVILTDHETGIMTNLQENDYTFDAKAGTSNARFSISFSKGTTGIGDALNSEKAEKEVYTLDGIMVGSTTSGLQRGVYVVRQGQKTQKVIVK